MKTRISVIIPYYQGKRYLPQLMQMMEKNARLLREQEDAELEVLLVNDSPWESIPDEADGSRESRSFLLKILTNPSNSGIHATRAHGLKAAEGEYVLFLDQDDGIVDGCLLSQLRQIGDADFVVGNGYDGEPGGGRHLIFADAAVQMAATELRTHYYYNNLIRSPGQVLIRKSSIPPYWTEQILENNGSDDAFLWILMLCDGCRAAVNRDVVYDHTFTGENASSNREAMLCSQMEVVSKLKGIASPVGMWAFRRRAEYYCTDGEAHRLRFLDVGILRKLCTPKRRVG